MPITDNKFTQDELTAALKANKDELLPLVKNVLSSADFKFVVRDETEEASFKSNYEASLIAGKTSEWAKKIDADVLAVTGVPKTSADEKYYDYMKRAFSAVKTELDTLKSKSNPSDADKARIQQLETAVADKEKALTDKTKELSEKIFNLTVDNTVNAAIAEYRSTYKKDMPASVITVMEKNAAETLRKQAKIQDDGSVVFLDDNKQVISNPTDLKPQSAKDIVKTHLADLIDTGKQQAGGGTGAGTQAPADAAGGAAGAGQKQKLTTLPIGVTSKTQLTEYLLKNSYTDSDPAFAETLTTLGANLPIQ